MEMHPAPFHSDVADGPDTGVAHWLTTSDGVRIRMAHWRAANEKGTVLMFPGRTEYIEKYGRAADEFGERGYAMLAIDWRGQGLADRLIDDRAAGYVEEFSDYQKDIAAVLEAAEKLELPKPYFVIGHSMGGCIGLRAVMSGLPVNAAVFSAPMWGILMSSLMRPAAWAMSWGSKKTGIGHKLAPGTKSKTYVLAEPFDGNTLTRDIEMFRYMQDQVTSYPDLALGGPSMHWLHEALVEMRELSQMPAPDVPCLTFLGDSEQIVDPARIHKRMEGWSNGTLDIVKDGEHEVMMEVPETRDRVFTNAAAFFDAHLGDGGAQRTSA
ncbi:alpha/beta hydrolase [Shimia thalassica]|uniref:alpha/beta hydrolase n=1 Tax=Shimia thalassica TaxID=1715693 RepID=UPI0026E33734|nr:alpha/beta hydrolase [Shimia thalassica]MDO6522489.1 alpha/beta hydrolase [Shimia thalassica]